MNKVVVAYLSAIGRRGGAAGRGKAKARGHTGDAFDGFEVVNFYPAAQAVEDGVLVDCESVFPGLARDCGFSVPVRFGHELFYILLKKGDLVNMVNAAALLAAARSQLAGAFDAGETRAYFDFLGESVVVAVDETSGPAVHIFLISED